MKRLILVLAILLFLPAFVSAHPGRTASDGCHYCRTNCDKWGVPWGKRHCHNRESEPLPISKIQAKNKETRKVKTPGWEYGLKFKRTNTFMQGNSIEMDVNDLNKRGEK
jgi:hypothetical protein